MELKQFECSVIMHEEKKWIQFISELTPWATEMEKTRRGAGVEGKNGEFYLA